MAKTKTKTRTAFATRVVERTPQLPALVGDTPQAMISAIVRAASDPAVDVTKMNALLDLKERMDRKLAESEFNTAMVAAQTEMVRIGKNARNSSTNSGYVTYDKLDSVIRPIYIRHGFSLSFDTGETDKADTVRIVCYVSHRSGHSRTYHFDIPADGLGAKGGAVMTKTHAAGSAASYGRRYLLIMVFNLSIGETDEDDGNAAGKRDAEQLKANEPAHYQNWLADMMAVADEGVAATKKAWAGAKPEFRVFASASGDWDTIKAKAKGVQS